MLPRAKLGAALLQRAGDDLPAIVLLGTGNDLLQHDRRRGAGAACGLPDPAAGRLPRTAARQRTWSPTGTERVGRFHAPAARRFPAVSAGYDAARLGQLQPNGAVPARQTIPSQPPVRLDRIASGPANGVQGKVVRGDKQPLSGVHLLFISSDRKEPRRSADTDADGQFHVQLASGGWL